MRANLGQTVLRYVRTLVVGQPADGHSDGALLEQFIRGRSETAFAALLDRHGRMVLSVCRRVLRDEHLSEDAFQATFLVLARKAGSIRQRTALASWLHGVALRLALRLYDQTQRAARPMNPATLPSVAAPATTHCEECQILDEELQRLPERYRLPLVLCYLEGQTHNEAALQLGWSTGKLRGLLERGRERLRARLVRRGVTLPMVGAATLVADTTLSAAVPPLLAVSTLKTAVLFSGGKTLAETGVTAFVAVLAEEGLHMIGSKKTGMVLLLVLFASMVGTGVALLASGQHKPPPVPAEINKDAEHPLVADKKGQEKPEGKRAGRPMLFVDHDQYAFRVLSMALSADGKLLVTGGGTGYGPTHGIEVWEVSTGRLARKFDSYDVRCLALSADGRWLVTADQWTRLWDLATDKEVHTFNDPVGVIKTLSMSANGKILATATSLYEEDKTARLWDVTTGKLLRTFQHNAPVATVALSADGNRLVTGGAAIHVWDTDTGKELTRPSDGDSSGPLAVSADGKWWATIADTNRERLVNLAEGRSVRLWDAQTGKLVRSFKNPEDRFYRSVTLSPDGKWLWTYGENTFFVPISRKWDVASGKEVESATIRGSSGVMTVSSDSTYFVVGHKDGGLAMREVAGNKLVRNFSEPKPLQYMQMALSGDGKRLVTFTEGPEPMGGMDPRVQTWDLVKGQPAPMPFMKPGLEELEDQRKKFPRSRYLPSPRVAVALSRDGKWLSMGDLLWDLDEGKQIARLPVAPGVSAEGKKWLERYVIHPSSDAVLSADNKWLYRGNDQGAWLWDVATGDVVRQYPTPAKDPGDGSGKTNTAVALSRDGKLLATTHPGDWSVILWDVNTGKEIRKIPWDGKLVRAPFTRGDNTIRRSAFLAFSSDGRWLVRACTNGMPAGSNMAPRMWEVATGKEVQLFQGPVDNVVRDIAITPDSKRLLTLNFDRTIRVWDLATGKELCKLLNFDREAWAVVDAEGRYDSSNDGNIEGLYWSVGNATFPLSRFKECYYDPGMLAKYLGFTREPLRMVQGEQ